MSFELQLINAVKKEPALYDRNNPDNSSRDARDIAWIRVTYEVGYKDVEMVDKCKTRWKSLRDAYYKELVSSVYTKGKRKWRFFDELSFLKPFYGKPEKIGQKRPTVKGGEPPLKKSKEDLFSEIIEELPMVDVKPNIGETVLYEEPYEDVEELITVDNYDNATNYTFEQLEVVPSGSKENINEHTTTTVTTLNPPSANNKNPQNLLSMVQLAEKVINSRENEFLGGRNVNFYKLMDEYMVKIPEKIQDKLKMELTKMIFQKYEECMNNK